MQILTEEEVEDVSSKLESGAEGIRMMVGVFKDADEEEEDEFAMLNSCIERALVMVEDAQLVFNNVTTWSRQRELRNRKEDRGHDQDDEAPLLRKGSSPMEKAFKELQAKVKAQEIALEKLSDKVGFQVMPGKPTKNPKAKKAVRERLMKHIAPSKRKPAKRSSLSKRYFADKAL